MTETKISDLDLPRYVQDWSEDQVNQVIDYLASQKSLKELRKQQRITQLNIKTLHRLIELRSRSSGIDFETAFISCQTYLDILSKAVGKQQFPMDY